MRSPCTSSMREAAKPPISAWRTLAGSAPIFEANSSASPTASMVSATMIWFATLQVWPSPLLPTSVMFLPINSNNGFTWANAPSVPPAMMVSEAAFFLAYLFEPVFVGGRGACGPPRHDGERGGLGADLPAGYRGVDVLTT